MKKKTAKKLTLSLETLRQLSDGETRWIRGAGGTCPVDPTCKPCDTTLLDCSWWSVCIC